ncbi:MAG: hypothetical protein WCS70_07340 [Verrucomicrobiota bacterium]
MKTLQIGDAVVQPRIENGLLLDLGVVQVGGTAIRHPGNRWLPWFDTFDGDVFRQFKFLGIEQRGDETVIATRAVSDPDVIFREFRDTSGDLCFRQKSWDAAPVEAELRVHFVPVRETVDGRAFTGFEYWFEYDGPAIHRLIDRATWELGGNLDDVTICLRSWLTKPRVRLAKDVAYSTAGFEHLVGCMPGNMWARWSLLPAFDMQYGCDGILLAWFDRVSLIRTVIETVPGEDWLRVIDSHWFESGTSVRTNPKTIVWSPDRLDETDALNLWTRLHDREHDRACAQFQMRAELPPQIVISHNAWVNFRFASTYEDTLGVAAELGADYMFVDPPWEHMEAFRSALEEWLPEAKRKGTVLEKLSYANMCATLDWKVAEILGGEKELKALCDRAAEKGVKVISWMALHNTPYSVLRQYPRDLGVGTFGIFAARESGRHPDTGYPGDCWPLNLNAPVGDYVREQILGVCERTGLAGFLWDSFSNLGWWQVDYSKGDMRPQFDKMAGLYAALVNAGLYLTPEGQCTFANASMLGMYGGNTYADDMLGYSYNTATSLWWGEYHDGTSFDCRILRGQEPVDMLFQCFAHKRAPMMTLHLVPRAEWNPAAAAALKELFAQYKAVRHLMQKRTVLKDNAGVLWEGPKGEQTLFAFRDGGGRQANRVYRL